MKLTEREKWLMNLAYSERGIYDKYTDLLNDKIESYIANEAPKPKSIVKKVDVGNLPTHRVITFAHDYVCIGKYESKYVFVSENGNRINNPHYIEQKDLIKLFGSVK